MRKAEDGKRKGDGELRTEFGGVPRGAVDEPRVVGGVGVDLYEQLGGGWSDAVPFDCEDACSEVTVEILVMDYWCNWSKCWTKVLVEDKTPVTVVHEVDDRTCSMISVRFNIKKSSPLIWGG